MSGKTIRILLVVALALVAFTAVLGTANAQGTTGTATATAAMSNTGTMGSATPSTLPRTGGETAPMSTATVVLLALGATAGLGGLLLRGLRQPQ